MNLNLKVITGFECSEPIIDIKDALGRNLYYFENTDEKRITFNLIPGNWTTKNYLTELKQPIRYVSPGLPKPDKKIPIVAMRYTIKDNPNKCSVDVKTGLVIIDPSIANRPIPFFNFVLFHELGHFYYNGGEHEHYCDIWAARKMLEYGFNPSQIYYSQEFCLSDNNVDRKNFLYNWLKKVKVYEH